jgi:hypothetical protein
VTNGPDTDPGGSKSYGMEPTDPDPQQCSKGQWNKKLKHFHTL